LDIQLFFLLWLPEKDGAVTFHQNHYHFMFGLDPLYSTLLIACLLAACAFEFINGFHDTANAVATVIYTHSLKPTVAVIWAGLWNFVGVNVGGIAVAIGIVNLLPMEILVDQNLAHNLSMILALIITAIIWNLATWYIGIPCSSSHTLIGSIFGVGLAFMLIPGSHAVALNWNKVIDAGLSLLVSPIFGFGVAFLLMLLLNRVIRNKEIFKEPPAKKAPPTWIRGILIATCTSVCYAHGSNDGQKGVGLIMLILISFAPTYFAIDRSRNPENLLISAKKIEWSLHKIDTASLSAAEMGSYGQVKTHLSLITVQLHGITNFDSLEKKEHFALRKSILIVSKQLNGLLTQISGNKTPCLKASEVRFIKSNLKEFNKNTEYSPRWVILMVSLALGFGTMVGWKRIVVTVGEKIGKTHLTYAQGATAQFIAASTIGASSMLGLPVSTTHVLSSGIAGTMVAGKGRQNLRMGTVKNIMLAWLITLPVTILLSGGLFLLFRLIVK
jgi:phosphate/sulfate permease